MTPATGAWVSGQQAPVFHYRVLDAPADGRRSDKFRPPSVSTAFHRICIFSYFSGSHFEAAYFAPGPSTAAAAQKLFSPGRLWPDSQYSGGPLLAGPRMLCLEPEHTTVVASFGPFVGSFGTCAVAVDAQGAATSRVLTTVAHSGLGGALGAGGIGEIQHAADRRHRLPHLPECDELDGRDAHSGKPLADCVPPKPANVAFRGLPNTIAVTVRRLHAGEHAALDVQPGVDEQVVADEAPVVLQPNTSSAASCKGQFAVVVVSAPDGGVTSNLEVFEDVAATVHGALLELGHDVVRIECLNL